ncbi:MAG: ribosome biogenesis GTP-binding protein YihA/YsxC [Candidatus Gracilibacteria bacterium]|nr:ribosome biogenesis GTP-binding protein YihA/YsxC [Candidatus Gracilibacteria bacterium]
MEIKEIKFLQSVSDIQTEYSPLKNINNKFKMLFVGRSNVGKSSLINSLLGKKDLAFSSSKAGKTKKINIFSVNSTFECLDFPGYGYARGSKEDRLILRDMILDYLAKNINEKIKIVMVVDALVGPTPLDQEIFDYLNGKGANILIILNKVDKTTQKILEITKNKIEIGFPQTSYIYYSCKTNKYKDFALNEIFKF